MELARRLFRGLPWPDGQGPTLPEGTKTLWVPGDRQQDEMKALATAYGLPHEAVLLNASPEEPYGGVSLDDPDNVRALRDRIEAERPGLVFIDTVWRCTRRGLGRADEVNALMDPLLEIAQAFDVAIVGMMHASKDGETIGRRLEGLARAVLKMTKPDPENEPERRRFWVDRANFLEPAPLGVTMHEAGCDFDSNPPAEASPARGGRPPAERGRAEAFLREALAREDGQATRDLLNEWQATGGSKSPFFDARAALVEAGEMSIGAEKPQRNFLIRPASAGPS